MGRKVGEDRRIKREGKILKDGTEGLFKSKDKGEAREMVNGQEEVRAQENTKWERGGGRGSGGQLRKRRKEMREGRRK